MNTYLVEGTSREVGAIGICTPFSFYICADTAKQAYDAAREKQYSENREMVMVKQIRTEYMGELCPVDPKAYLF